MTLSPRDLYDRIVYEYDGETPHTNDKGEPLTLGSALVKACQVVGPEDNNLGPMQRYAIGEAGMVVYRGLPLTKDQRELLQERVKAVFLNPAMVYTVVSMLAEPEPEAPAEV